MKQKLIGWDKTHPKVRSGMSQAAMFMFLERIKETKKIAIQIPPDIIKF